jgi:hypothetical protein
MHFRKLFKCFSVKKDFPTVVTFTGGTGAQILSAAIYFSMKDTGQAVYADLSYFNSAEKKAIVGNAGECSHWSWRLDSFGLPQASFEASPGLTKRNANILWDGPEKWELGLKALAQPNIQGLFKVPADLDDLMLGKFADSFLCIHVRRGDYVNVFSHLVADSELLGIARRFSGLVEQAVVLSDSPIESSFRSTVSSYFKEASFLDDIEPDAAHRIMRSARILICSNSSFSLTAGALNPNALVVIPKQWVEGSRRIEAPIQSRCSFQIIDNGRI